MQDRIRVAGGNGKSSKLMCPSTYNPSSFATFLSDLKAGNVYVDVTATQVSEGGVTTMGTALNKANLLTDTTAQGFGFSVSDDPTINDVFKRIGADYISGTLTAGQTSLTLVDDRIKTTSTVDIYASVYGVNPKTVTLANGSMTMTFKTYTSNISIRARVY